MAGFPYNEKQTVWDRPLTMRIHGPRTADWYGFAGFYNRAGGDIALARRHMNEWNPWTRALLREGDVVVDCGANEGFTSVVFAKAVGPRGKVFAIEADADNCEKIRENIALNDVHNVEVVHRAVAEESGKLVRFHAERVHLEPVGAEVETVNLDDFCDGKKIDFVKVDVEGFEVPVIRGALAMIERCSPRMEIELHISPVPGGVNAMRLYGYDAAELLMTLEQRGYTIRQDGVVVPPGTMPLNGSIWTTRFEAIVHAAKEAQ